MHKRICSKKELYISALAPPRSSGEPSGTATRPSCGEGMLRGLIELLVRREGD